MRRALRARHYSPRTERVYVHWAARFIFFHKLRHPDELGEKEVTSFLSWLAIERRVSASTQNQALAAILFLYRDVLRRDLDWMDQIVRAKRPQRLPVVLAREEVAAVLRRMDGTPWLLAALMYGAGLRVLESVRLRVKDLDFQRHEILIRDGKGKKDRLTVLPKTAAGALMKHLERVRGQHARDLSRGRGAVELPRAIARKYPGAAKEWAWQWVFPAARCYTDQQTGERRRHHLHESVVQRAFKAAVRNAGISKHATCHTLRHYAEFRIMRSWAREVMRSVVNPGDLLQLDRLVSA